jgi:plasmid stabilization system protein ParE
MPSDVVWSARAERDLKNLHDYIAVENPRAALRYASALQETCLRLVDYPLSGRSFNDTYRVLVYRNHLVLHRYDPERNVVVVVRVVDARRDLGVNPDQLDI